jgi:hypothetical protein
VDVWAQRGVKAAARGAQQAAIWQAQDDKRGTFVLKPDGLLVKYKSSQGQEATAFDIERAYAVELQYKSSDTAMRKVKQYEAFWSKALENAELWQERWGMLPEIPAVLFIYRKRSKLLALQPKMAERFAQVEPFCHYVGIALEDVLKAPDPIERMVTLRLRKTPLALPMNPTA